MGSGGTEWDAVDSYSAARLNQKTVFVGTGTQIAALGTTYAGQLAFATSTTGGFTADTLYERNAANTTWLSIEFTETAEANTTPVTDDANFDAIAGTRYYAFFTLPATEKLYLITGIEWKNGTNVAGTIVAGIDVVDANPPTLAPTPLLTLAAEATQTGADTIQRISRLSTRPVRGGTILGAWVHSNSSSSDFREDAGLSSQNQQKTSSYSASPGTQNTDSWVAATGRKYLKVYYVGYT